jgi:hypothetical protein
MQEKPPMGLATFSLSVSPDKEKSLTLRPLWLCGESEQFSPLLDKIPCQRETVALMGPGAEYGGMMLRNGSRLPLGYQ